MAEQQFSDNYAESVNIAGVTADGRSEINIRLSRKPIAATGSIWAHLAINGRQYSLVDESLDSGEFSEATDLTSNSVEYFVSGDSQARFTRQTSLRLSGKISAALHMHQTAHPDDGSGPILVSIEANFIATGPGADSGKGRIEVMGQVTASVSLEGQTNHLEMNGKWHEQVGERGKFAPAFTYLNVQSDELGLLAIGYQGGATGYLILGENVDPVVSFEIAPLDPHPKISEAQPPRVRSFEITTLSGQHVWGQATELRRWSVPIEGQRRPGSTVRVVTNLGSAAGSLNDWNP